MVIKANGDDVLAFQDNTGVPKWHWNLLNGGLNFVESNVLDYILFLQNGGKIGINTSDPQSILDINGSVSTPIMQTTANFTATDAHHTIILGDNHMVTLPAANTCEGRIYVLKNPTMAIIKCWDEKHRDLGIFDMNNLKMNSNQHYKTS